MTHPHHLHIPCSTANGDTLRLEPLQSSPLLRVYVSDGLCAGEALLNAEGEARLLAYLQGRQDARTLLTSLGI